MNESGPQTLIEAVQSPAIPCQNKSGLAPYPHSVTPEVALQVRAFRPCFTTF